MERLILISLLSCLIASDTLCGDRAKKDFAVGVGCSFVLPAAAAGIAGLIGPKFAAAGLMLGGLFSCGFALAIQLMHPKMLGTWTQNIKQSHLNGFVLGSFFTSLTGVVYALLHDDD